MWPAGERGGRPGRPTRMTPEALAEMTAFLELQIDADEQRANGNARAQREVRRKRNIVADCEFYVRHNNGPSMEAPMLAVAVLMELTAIYDTEPGYKQMWRPASDS